MEHGKTYTHTNAHAREKTHTRTLAHTQIKYGNNARKKTMCLRCTIKQPLTRLSASLVNKGKVHTRNKKASLFRTGSFDFII